MELLPPADYGDVDDYERLASLGGGLEALGIASGNPLASLPQWQYIRDAQSDVYGKLPRMMMEPRPDRPLWGYVEEESSLPRRLARAGLSSFSWSWPASLPRRRRVPPDLDDCLPLWPRASSSRKSASTRR